MSYFTVLYDCMKGGSPLGAWNFGDWNLGAYRRRSASRRNSRRRGSNALLVDHSPKNISQLKKGWGWRRKINHSKIITRAGAEIIGVS